MKNYPNCRSIAILGTFPRSAIAFVLGPRPEGFGSKMDPVGREASVDTLIYV